MWNAKKGKGDRQGWVVVGEGARLPDSQRLLRGKVWKEWNIDAKLEGAAVEIIQTATAATAAMYLKEGRREGRSQFIAGL